MAKEKLERGSAFKGANGGIKVVSMEDIKNKSVVHNIKIEDIKDPKTHDRKNYNTSNIEDLAKNISATGKLLQPIVLRVVNNQYERICGFRRIEAVKRLGWETIPSIVLNDISDEQASLIMLSENFQREDINIYDQTVGILEYLSIAIEKSFEEIKALLYRFRNSDSKVIIELNENEIKLKEQMNSIVGKIGNISIGTLINRLKLFSFSEIILNALQGGEISYVVATELNKIKDEYRVGKLIEQLKNGEISIKEIKTIAKESRAKTPIKNNKLTYKFDLSDDKVMIKIEQSLNEVQLKKLTNFLETL